MEANRILRTYFERKKKERSGYSLRALARDMKVQPSFLSAIFAEKKPVPAAQIDTMVKCLDIDPEVALEIKLKLIPRQLRAVAQTSNSIIPQWTPVERKNFALLRQWFYPVILDLTTCSNFTGTEGEIAGRLGLHHQTVAVAVRDLLAAGFLKLEDGKLVKATKHMRVASSSSHEDIRRFHKQMLDRAKLILESKTSESDFSHRLITGLVVAADRERIPAARKMLAEALHEIAKFLSAGETNEVFHLSAQLFPHTKD